MPGKATLSSLVVVFNRFSPSPALRVPFSKARLQICRRRYCGGQSGLVESLLLIAGSFSQPFIEFGFPAAHPHLVVKKGLTNLESVTARVLGEQVPSA